MKLFSLCVCSKKKKVISLLVANVRMFCIFFLTIYPRYKFQTRLKRLDFEPFWTRKKISEKKVKRSQYKGVHWHKENRKWFVLMCLKGGKKKYGGTFIDEIDAAKRVNQLCEEMEIPLQNPGISAIPTQQYQVT